jgi:hypothetical protein
MRIAIVVLTVAAGLIGAACDQSGSNSTSPPLGAAPPPADGSIEKPPARTGTIGSPDESVVAELGRRIDDYMALQNELEGTLSSLPDEATPQQIDTHQRALAAMIAKARSDARPGLVFSPAMQEFVRGVVGRVLEGPDGKALRDSITDEHPTNVSVQVNGRYPDTVPLSTMPPDILAALPPLPEELEYRFVGSRLILLDTKAHIVVDCVDDVFPGRG